MYVATSGSWINGTQKRKYKEKTVWYTIFQEKKGSCCVMMGEQSTGVLERRHCGSANAERNQGN